MKVSKLLVLGVLVSCLCIAGSALAQPTEVGIGISISARFYGTTDPANIVAEGDQIEYRVRVFVDAEQYPISGGEPTLTLPNGTVIDLADNLSLATSGQAIYFSGDYTGGVYTVSSAHLGSFGADSDKIRALAFVSATSDRPEFPQTVTADNEYDVLYDVNPAIQVVKSADPDAICEDIVTDITYTYTVTNEGDVDLDNISLVDDTSPCETPTYISGDTGGDGILGIDETWIYECVVLDAELVLDVTNIATVTGYDVIFDGKVEDTDTETVTVNAPPVVSVDPAEAVICDSELPFEFCAVIDQANLGTPPYTYQWYEGSIAEENLLEGETGDCIEVSEAGTYCVVVTDDAGCQDDACGTLEVIETPDCAIDDGPTTVCEETLGIVYSTDTIADTYLWEISGNGTIVSAVDGPSVTVDAGLAGTFTLTLTVCNEVDEIVLAQVALPETCCDTCTLDVTVGECGGGYCTFTQGFYGNEGGKACDGKTTTEIINAVILPANPVIVGILDERSITFSTAADIILRLPCGGTPRALPEDLNVNANDTATLKTAKLLKGKDDRINNTLVGQVVALTLNMRLSTIPCLDADGFDQPLGSYEFPNADYICVQKGEDGCIMRYAIPESLQGLSVDALLATANLALAGDEKLVAGAYDGASFVNELFDECWTIVTCPDIDEICDNGCDDDFDGDVDCADEDCSSDPACAI